MWHRSTALWFGAIAFVAGLASVDRVAGQGSGKPQTPKTVRLYVFDCGVINVNRAGTERYKVTPEEVGETLFSALLPGRSSEGHADVGSRHPPGRHG